jgi:PAS domain S-box-containing protein
MTDTSHPGITPDDTGTVPDFDIASGRVGTERKRAEEALREAQMALAHTNRVATMGQLAASTRMIAAPVEHLDPARVIKISQADTGEIVLETLIDGLLRAAMEHAGVERCLLIGQRDDELEIQAEATMSREDATVHLRDEGRIRRLVDSNIIGIIFVWDLEGRIIEANDAFLYMVGYDREDLVSGRVRWTDLTPAEWRERDERALAELSSTGTVQPYEKEYFRKDGSRVPVLIGCALSEESHDEGVAFVLDLTERKRADEALRESEAKFRDYAETASDWFWEIGPDYKFTLLTENAFGSDPARRIGTACWEHALDLETEPEKWRVVQETLDARRPFRDFVYRSVSGNDTPMYVKASGKPVFDTKGEFRGYRGTGIDVTATMRAQEEHERLHQLESELAHMNRLGIIGEQAASLVHEITQPIATARNNARAALNFLDRQPSELGEVREALACVVGDADRAGEIIDRIRDHIRKAPPRKARFDLNDAIDEVLILGRSAITKNEVLVQTRFAEGLSPVQADRVQLQQVILNLVLNAVEAMGAVEAGPRELLISTERTEANGVLVAIRDSGPGIDPEHVERVFEAFYTTKPSGVGMGLSICRSIIDAHGGRLWADANEPRGAVFQFTLPGVES